MEQMWERRRGRLEEDGTATVLTISAYLYDVNFGDRVNVMRSAEKALVVTGVERDARNFTFRVVLKSHDPKAWQPLAYELGARMPPRFHLSAVLRHIL
ncbi:DUF4265 domain-containing protein [Paenarthrobacter sp. NPDC090520]|uniref:DUF4265 domain-containing protein n=1 Tax=Paenarthrobacter sp. NPDC090520 TaxID=3364382 RepID=UPI0037F8634B